MVKPNEFHLDAASTSTSGTVTTTDSFGFMTESDYEADGTRVAFGYLMAAPDDQPVALLTGLDLVFSGYASSEAGVDTTMFSFGINGALGVRFGAGRSPVFLDLLAQLGLGMTALDMTSNTMIGTGTLARLAVGGSLRPGVWLDDQQKFGLYGLIGVESTMPIRLTHHHTRGSWSLIMTINIV